MLDETAACARVLALLGPRGPWGILDCRLSRDGTHYVVEAQTEAYVRTGEAFRALPGMGYHLVDRTTGEVEALRFGIEPEDVLQDRRDAAEAGTRMWVVRPSAGFDAASIVRLRKWLQCTPERARTVARSGAWFVGPRRWVADVERRLSALGLPVEMALVDDPGEAIHLGRIGGELDDLRAALGGEFNR